VCQNEPERVPKQGKTCATPERDGGSPVPSDVNPSVGGGGWATAEPPSDDNETTATTNRRRFIERANAARAEYGPPGPLTLGFCFDPDGGIAVSADVDREDNGRMGRFGRNRAWLDTKSGVYLLSREHAVLLAEFWQLQRGQVVDPDGVLAPWDEHHPWHPDYVWDDDAQPAGGTP
jgi:hypothetical protein